MPAALIFTILALLTGATVTGTTIYGIKTGEIERIMVKPVKQYLQAIKNSATATPRPTFTPPPIKTASPSARPSLKPTPKPTAKPKVRVNTSTKVIIVTPQPQTSSNSQTPSFDNKAWFDEQVKLQQQQADQRYQQSLQEQNAWSEQQKLQQQQDMEQWKKDHGISP